jgi:uncharacterized membrane protein
MLKKLQPHSAVIIWLLIGLILRLINLGAKPPWTDEFSTLVFSLGNSFLGVPLDQPIDINVLLQPLQPRSSANVRDVLNHLLTESNHPPLYFILTHWWLKLFPNDGGLVSVWGARSLAAIFGAVGIPAIYALSWLIYRSRIVSNLAAAMIATSPYAIFLAQETRHYTLPILWVIASFGCFIIATRCIKNSTKLPIKIALIWVVINALGIATHYFFALTLFTEAFVLIFLLVKGVGSGEWGIGKGKREKGEVQRTPSTSPSSSTPHSLIPTPFPRIFAVAMGTAVAGAVWIPAFLQNSYGGKLTEWIQGDRVGLAWLNPIFQALAAWITMLYLLPVESPYLAIIIASGLVMLAFLIWVVPILIRSFKATLKEPQSQFETQMLVGLVGSAIALFFIFTYFLGIDLTRGARYNFVYFPAVMVLLGASLAVCWQTAAVKIFKWQISGKKAVVIIWLMSLASAITVVNNLGYQKYYRPDLFVELIQKTSSAPVLIATTQKTHVHIGEMMGIAREFKISQRSVVSGQGSVVRGNSSSTPYSPLPTPQFLLAHQDNNSDTSTAALAKTLKALPRPFDLWLVNFYANKPEELDKCLQENRSLTAINGYEYKIYRCR